MFFLSVTSWRSAFLDLVLRHTMQGYTSEESMTTSANESTLATSADLTNSGGTPCFPCIIYHLTMWMVF